jgi:hypothetical protein
MSWTCPRTCTTLPVQLTRSNFAGLLSGSEWGQAQRGGCPGTIRRVPNGLGVTAAHASRLSAPARPRALVWGQRCGRWDAGAGRMESGAHGPPLGVHPCRLSPPGSRSHPPPAPSFARQIPAGDRRETPLPFPPGWRGSSPWPAPAG